MPPIRVGLLAESAFGPVDAEVAVAVHRAGDALAGLGCQVEPAAIPALERNDWNLLTLTLFGAEGRRYFESVIRGRDAELHPALRRRLAAPLAPLEDYLAADAEVEALRRDLATFFVGHDILVCMTTPVVAHAHEAAELEIAGRVLPARAIMRATIPFDLTGSPALVVPFALSAERLPIGVQVVGRRFDEATVLRVGSALERLRDVSAVELRPPL